MMPENKSSIQKIGLNIKNLVLDPPKADLDTALEQWEDMIYRKTRIIHLLFLGLIPIIVITIMIMIHIKDKNSSISTNFDGLIIVLLFTSVAILVSGALTFFLFYNRRGLDTFQAINTLFRYHILRTVGFMIPVLLGYISWNLGGRWFLLLPFFALSAIALIFTFPTRKRWERWRFG
jgi:hypothetical protein